MDVRLSNIVFAVSIVAAVPAAAATSADAALIAPSPLTVSVQNGKGTATVYLAVAETLKDSDLPKIDVTAAVSPVGDTVPRTDIHTITGTPTKGRLVPVEISVATLKILTPNTAYNATVSIFTIPRQDLVLTITRPVATALDVDPKTLTTTLIAGDSGKRTVRIRNLSTTLPLQAEMTSLGYANAQGVSIADEAKLSPVLVAGRTKTTDIVLPYPRYAGTYTGAIDVTGPTSETKTIAVSYTVRGPYAKYGLPIILFFGILLVGALIAFGLESLWSDRRLAELEIERDLGAAMPPIERALAIIERWKLAGADLPATRWALTGTIESIATALDTIGRLTPDQMREVAAMATNRARAAAALAAELSDPPDPATAKAADGVPLDTQNYRTALRKAISGADLSESEAALEARPRTADDVTKSLTTIRRIRWLIVMLVVFLTAFLTFFQPDPQFGTCADYIKVFFWALGLTQTGSQIVTRIRAMPR
jgi:hypothetical protein